MNKKYMATILLVTGIILICLSIVLAVIETSNKNIVGGADFPTFIFVFFREKKGLYYTLAFSGIVSLISSAIVGLRKGKK